MEPWSTENVWEAKLCVCKLNGNENKGKKETKINELHEGNS